MPQQRFDPELLQIRWVLGGMRPEDLLVQATQALEQGFDGTALRQLAGLVQPTLRDLENLPGKAFAEMGLNEIDKDQAAASLIARGLPQVSNVISVLVKSFPSFSERWRRHIVNWSGEPAGSYNDIDQFVHFVVDDLYSTGDRAEVRRFFRVLEKILEDADESTKNLIALGFFERLQNQAFRRTLARGAFEEFLGPQSKLMWNDLQAAWDGKSGKVS